MSAILIKDAIYQDVTENFIVFHYVGGNGAGFCFDADSDFRPILKNDTQITNYAACLTGEFRGSKITGPFKESQEKTVKVSNTIRKCVCGKHIEFYGHGADEQCDRCHREYNSSGQLLAPRRFWGEETNERPSDVAKAFRRR